MAKEIVDGILTGLFRDRGGKPIALEVAMVGAKNTRYPRTSVIIYRPGSNPLDKLDTPQEGPATKSTPSSHQP